MRYLSVFFILAFAMFPAVFAQDTPAAPAGTQAALPCNPDAVAKNPCKMPYISPYGTHKVLLALVAEDLGRVERNLNHAVQYYHDRNAARALKQIRAVNAQVHKELDTLGETP